MQLVVRLLCYASAEQKVNYLQRLWKKTYLADVIERHNIRNTELLENLADVLCSAVVIVGDDIAPWTDEKGISYMGLFQFLRDGLPK